MTISDRLPVRIDSADPAALSRVAPAAASDRQKFWSSPQRPVTSPISEIVEVALNSPRWVNLISFEVSRFPLTLSVDYLDEIDEVWRPLQYEQTSVNLGQPTAVREQHAVDVGLSIAESVPAKVNLSSRGESHPQHFGQTHWRRSEWRTIPVHTEKIRFVLTRNPQGSAPLTPQGDAADYSVALRQIRIGYRVTTEQDIPPVVDPTMPWETSKDFLGSTVSYSVYQQDALRVMDDNFDTSWRSAPQPVNYAVVPMYLDLRDEEGLGQTVDKFFVDPTTAGVHCNLYFCDEEPEGDFLGGSKAVPYRYRNEQGIVAASTDKTALVLGSNSAVSGVSVAKIFTNLDQSKGWWVGLDVQITSEANAAGSLPIVAVGGNRLVQEDGNLRFVAESGEEIEVPLPTYFVPGGDYRATLAYYPAADGNQPSVVLTFSGYEEYSGQIAVDLAPGLAPISIGLNPDEEVPDVSDLAIRGVVVKSEVLSEESQDWFFAEGADYVIDDQKVRALRRNTSLNAVLRMHPDFASEENPFGLIGGDADRLSRHAIWRPIENDYILHRGFMEFRPVRARYWKFEYTQLAPRLFETFQTIDRVMLCFPAHLVREHDVVGPQPTRAFFPHGVQTMVTNRTATDLYSDAISALRLSGAGGPGPEAASALAIRTPHLAEEAVQTGWVWQFQPWHSGSISPRWHQPGKHFYEQILVRHSTKVAYFVGIKELVPHRSEYSQPDDTEEYVERFLDDHGLDDFTDLDLRSEGGVVAISNTAEVVSGTYASYLTVRGLQFASWETGPVQVLPDPDFVNKDLSLHYEGYGDASLARIETNHVDVTRGWSGRWYADMEQYTYEEMEAFTYAELEGRSADGGEPPLYAEGGIVTIDSYSPMGPGRVIAKVKVSAKDTLAYPITVDLVSAESNILLGTSEKAVGPGSPTTITAEFPGRSLVDWHTYGEVEHLSADPNAPQTPSEAASDIGPGSTASGAPTVIEPHALSVSPGVVENRYYRVDPTESGTFGMDLLLSTLDDGTTPADFHAIFFINSGLTSPTYTVTDGKAQVTGSVTAGTPVIFSLSTFVTSGSNFLHPPTTLRLRTSDVGDTALWDPELASVVEGEATYADLENYTYAQLEARDGLFSKVKVRVRQTGDGRDVFRVHRIALYDEPIVWSFSVDDGETWQEAFGVKNDPHGALLFQTPGNRLKWKAQIFRPDASISALHIRPWYGNAPAPAAPFFDLEQTGPTQSGWDVYPSLPQHPLWKPIPDVDFEVVPPEEPEPFWRNLAPNPGAEGASAAFWVATGGTIETDYSGGA